MACWLALLYLAGCAGKGVLDCADCGSDPPADADADTDSDTDTDADTDPTGPPTSSTTPPPLYQVCASGAPFSDIQDAVDAASPGDVITICPGNYGHVVISGIDLTLQGDDRATTVIDGQVFFPALSVEYGAVTVSGVTLTGSTTTFGGVAGLNAQLGAIVTLTDCAISGQRSPGTYAYAILADSSFVTLERVLMEDDQSDGLLQESAEGGSIAIAHSVFRNNTLAAMWNFYGVDVDFTNNLVYGNTIVPNASGMVVSPGGGNYTMVVRNNTFADNTYPTSACELTAPVVFEDNIVSGNGSAQGIDSSDVVARYDDVWGQTDNFPDGAGHGSIEVNPRFVDPAAGDYTLDPTSPCIDAGDPDPLLDDVDGTPNDMGAFGGPGGSWTPPA